MNKTKQKKKKKKVMQSSGAKLSEKIVKIDEVAQTQESDNKKQIEMENESKHDTELSTEEIARLDAECKAADSHELNRRLSVNETMWDDVWTQLLLLDAPAVLDNTAEIVIQYGYIMLFVLVFPLMFAMAVVNNFVEFRLDFYALTQSRRSVPYAASGLGVWKQVLGAFSTVAVFSNLAIITWRTDLAKWHATSSADTNKVIYFFVITFLLLLFQFMVRFFIPDVTIETKDALERQEVCLFFFLIQNLYNNCFSTFE
ncbi:hypothetical protein RFI_04618 [Reticulomyxa filosa]|uniref:Anoctamin transmembrane domain-containing protein n=1 Tax=Reticulomyxa filosa TaxID=46433 RepID=X6P4H9_RETFI|nr:hypothetical protein RFI_04618 [Reticulomyxa filosa]|eukprot:ETO32502.1 hypothetical protein RFI_04618 [Reticulomyxa filosa]